MARVVAQDLADHVPADQISSERDFEVLTLSERFMLYVYLIRFIFLGYANSNDVAARLVGSFASEPFPSVLHLTPIRFETFSLWPMIVGIFPCLETLGLSDPTTRLGRPRLHSPRAPQSPSATSFSPGTGWGTLNLQSSSK